MALTKLKVGLLVLSLAGPGAAGAGRAQPRAESDTVRMETLDVSDSLYVVNGGGGAALILVANGDVVLVDTKRADLEPPLQDIVRAVTDQPPTLIVNTHAHADHTGGNDRFPTVREIVTHVNARNAMQRVGSADAATTAPPSRTYIDRLELLDGIDRMELRYFGRGHTDGDTVVVFPAKGVAYLGDLFPGKAVPVVDLDAGGSAVALPETLGRLVEGIGDVTRIVAAHPAPGGPTSWRWRDVEEYAAFTRELVAAVAASFHAGRSEAEAIATLDLPPQYEEYDMEHLPAMVHAVYRELAP